MNLHYKLNDKNIKVEWQECGEGYHNLIHEQAIWVTFCDWNGTFLRAKWKKVNYSQCGSFKESYQTRENRRIFDVNFHNKMQHCWLSFMLVGSFSFLQEFEISFKLRFTTFSQKKYQKIWKINHSSCYKNWLLYSIWDICWYQWLQVITN